MDGPPPRRGGRRVPGKGDGVPSGDGGPRPLWEAVPFVRHGSPAHSLRGQRDELLPALPDGREGPGRPRPLATAQGRLAAEHRGTGEPIASHLRDLRIIWGILSEFYL